jgi:hypothetical protein
MDQVEKLNRYRQIIERVLETHSKMPAVPETVEGMVVFDPVRDQYLLMDVGWAPYGRAHDVVVHLRLKDGKVWVEWDGIEYGIAQDLIEAGIPEEDIVMSFERDEPKTLQELAAA